MRWLSSHAYQTALWVLSRHGRVLDAARNFQGSAKLEDDAMVIAVGIG